MASSGLFFTRKSELKNLWFQLFQILKEPAEFIKEPAKNCGFPGGSFIKPVKHNVQVLLQKITPFVL
jgi:hypothetical protein